MASDLEMDDAIDFLARHLATKVQPSALTASPQIPCSRQYDVEIRHLAEAFWKARGQSLSGMANREGERFYRPFFDAAWYLCRIGVLRPGEVVPSEGIRGPGWGGDSPAADGQAPLPSYRFHPGSSM